MKTLTFTNITIIVVGLVIMSVGLYRVMPLKLDKAFMWQNGPLAVMFILGLLLLGERINIALTKQLISSTVILGGRFFPLMVFLCFVMALGTIIANIYGSQIEDFINRHHVMAPLVASWFTPTPSSVVPVIDRVWKNRVLQPYLLYFLQSASLVSLPLFMLRQLGIKNPEISIKMYLTGFIICTVTFPFVPLIGRVVQWMYSIGEKFGLV